MNSSLLHLNFRDLGKGLVLAVLVAVLEVGLQLLKDKGFDLSAQDLAAVLDLSLKVAGAYLLKNLLSDKEGKFLGKVG